ncbi:MAG TPA: carbon-nitrogen family hydrolase [Bacilli bacterium]
MTEKLRVALIQMHVQAGEPEANFAAVTRRLQQVAASEPKPDLIILPEMWNTGYALPTITETADENGSRTKDFFSAFSSTQQINVIAGSVSVKTKQGVKNVAYAFDRNGKLVAEYAKLHLFRLMDEEKYLIGGNKSELAQFDGVLAGLMICYDLRFPELARKYALAGANILFVPAEWPHPRLHHWRTLLQARAIENQLFVVACNRVGISGGTHFFGHSMVVDPWGEIVAEGAEDEADIFAELDLTLVNRVRKQIPIIPDRRPEVY